MGAAGRVVVVMGGNDTPRGQRGGRLGVVVLDSSRPRTTNDASCVRVILRRPVCGASEVRVPAVRKPRPVERLVSLRHVHVAHDHHLLHPLGPMACIEAGYDDHGLLVVDRCGRCTDLDALPNLHGNTLFCERDLSLDRSRTGSQFVGRALRGVVWVENESIEHGEMTCRKEGQLTRFRVLMMGAWLSLCVS